MRHYNGVTWGMLLCLVLLGLSACSKSNGSDSKGGGAGGGSGEPGGAGRGGRGETDSGGSAGEPEAAAGAAQQAGSGGAAVSGDGGAGGADLVNPVQASEADTDPLGEDANSNGVRDDLEAYLGTLSDKESEQVLLVSLAREETRMILLGADPDSTASAVREQALRAMSVHHCLVDGLGEERSLVAITELQSALLNNELRWKAWLAADHELLGSILANTACDESLVQP